MNILRMVSTSLRKYALCILLGDSKKRTNTAFIPLSSRLTNELVSLNFSIEYREHYDVCFAMFRFWLNHTVNFHCSSLPCLAVTFHVCHSCHRYTKMYRRRARQAIEHMLFVHWLEWTASNRYQWRCALCVWSKNSKSKTIVVYGPIIQQQVRNNENTFFLSHFIVHEFCLTNTIRICLLKFDFARINRKKSSKK